MRFIDKIFKRSKYEDIEEQKILAEMPERQEEHYEPLNLPEGELVSFSDQVLNTNSRASIEKFKHNLEILVKKAKEDGKIDKFMIIRQDDFFPIGWEWKVLSKYTNLEKVCTPLSFELKTAYALEQQNINPYTEIMGLKVPTVTRDDKFEALKHVDKNLGSILLPPHFRSTKNFTINTPLGVTGDYNAVPTNRDFIIIDNVNSFLSSGYAYSVSYHDAYLDISHESLPISPEAVVLINKDKYEKIKNDPQIANELSKRKIILWEGDEDIAINMVLSEMGVLPSQVGSLYITYDNEIRQILDDSIKNLAKDNGLFFDKSHAGDLKPDGGHFSNYYDNKNHDVNDAMHNFITYLRQKFPEYEELFPDHLVLRESNSMEIVSKIGTSRLLDAINEYNELQTDKLKQSLQAYNEDRKNITPEVHQTFTSTISLINDYYKNDVTYSSYEEQNQIEETIQRFIQSGTVKEQLEAAKTVWELLPTKNINIATINMPKVVSNAITQGISIEKVANSDKAQYLENENQQKGDIIKDE